MSIIATAKRIDQTIFSKGWDQADGEEVARELLRLLDETPATPEWILASCDCAWSVEGGTIITGDVLLSDAGELTIGNCTIFGPVSRGFMRHMMLEMGVELKEEE